MENILEITDLSVDFLLDEGTVGAVDRVSLSVRENETFALIGESGSGKSVLGLAVLGLLPENARVEGTVRFMGIDLLDLSEKEMRQLLGRHIAWVPQNPATSMNPSMRVGDQIAEPMVFHLGLEKGDALKKTVSLLNYFGIKPAEARSREYPYHYSGGMLQRALVAMGTSTGPELIIADEPTKGVDAVKKQSIVALLSKVKQERVSMLLITHDLAFARVMADRIAVNYCGQIVEVCETEHFFDEPRHPYSQALIRSLPSHGLHPIEGVPPSMVHPPEGCRFHPRCPYATEICRRDEPPMMVAGDDLVRCWRYD